MNFSFLRLTWERILLLLEGGLFLWVRWKHRKCGLYKELKVGLKTYKIIDMILTLWIVGGNETKGKISKRVLQQKKVCQILFKTNISYPLIRTRTYAYKGLRNVLFFRKFGPLCFLDSPFCHTIDDFCIPFLEKTDFLMAIPVIKHVAVM